MVVAAPTLTSVMHVFCMQLSTNLVIVSVLIHSGQVMDARPSRDYAIQPARSTTWEPVPWIAGLKVQKAAINAWITPIEMRMAHVSAKMATKVMTKDFLTVTVRHMLELAILRAHRVPDQNSTTALLVESTLSGMTLPVCVTRTGAVQIAVSTMDRAIQNVTGAWAHQK